MKPKIAKILVIRHEPCTTLGLLNAIAHQTNSLIQYLDISEGERLTQPIEHYSHVVLLGGAISAYEDDRYPFLRDEFKLIETAINHALPMVGICLGSQVLARVLGARVYRGEAGREAGWCEVELTAAAAIDPLLKGFPPQFRVFQSHQDTFDLPANSIHLAKSATYPHQAFRYLDHVWALQFHLEFDETVLSSCSAVIEEELRQSNIQDTTVEQLLAEAKYHSPAVAPIASRFMQHFLRLPALNPVV
jgi:GMP synthase (glutamine-hydrolysing)